MGRVIILAMILVDKNLIHKAKTKIILFVIDGLGGVPRPEDGKTEMEAANTPNLDALAKKSVLGLINPVAPGVSPGSGPGHLSIFGYDPLQNDVGRGVLEALGVGMKLIESDVAARGNFATLDADGLIVDRRAGRPNDQDAARVVELLRKNIKEIEGVQVLLQHVKGHRFVVVFRGEGLSGRVLETDPQQEGVPPLFPVPEKREAEHTARIIWQFIQRAHYALLNEKKMNCVLLRGFSKLPSLQPFGDRYKMDGVGIAVYPMYKGVARVIGLNILGEPQNFEEEIRILEENWAEHEFFFIHYKDTDEAGEDGDFDRKVAKLEEADSFIPRLLALKPDVIAITGDHSTPALMAKHSWHPVPFMISGPFAGPDDCTAFTERQAKHGYYGRINAVDLMPLILANAGRAKKFGA